MHFLQQRNRKDPTPPPRGPGIRHPSLRYSLGHNGFSPFMHMIMLVRGRGAMLPWKDYTPRNVGRTTPTSCHMGGSHRPATCNHCDRLLSPAGMHTPANWPCRPPTKTDHRQNACQLCMVAELYSRHCFMRCRVPVRITPPQHWKDYANQLSPGGSHQTAAYIHLPINDHHQ